MYSKKAVKKYLGTSKYLCNRSGTCRYMSTRSGTSPLISHEACEEYFSLRGVVRALFKTVARVEPEELCDPERIFIARSLRLALRAEEWLATAGVDYAVQVEPISRSLLFRTERMGAVFYVNAGQASYCREQLVVARLGSGVVERDEVTGISD